ncbi:hypothetical protein [Allorhodopirellula heiligendammensis]|uniref:Uncharacterized protein n=1 Tax=Allorhodopirellula heiligendammensis TaxID=2714739 RepID=A0A5C6C736_9BACT|nr:hypothetical protein [Allorhodopirellula heiligendammensis]TWU19905.1 hypothetical protein Poly21_20840 [Allorhodopirellula heiligendammensis]
MNWNGITLAIIGALAVWRALWLAAGVPNTTDLADRVRREAQSQCDPLPRSPVSPSQERWRISFASVADQRSTSRGAPQIVATGTDVWDPDLPIWITPGRDRAPGWADWDDNGDGVVDDSGELGAAWSDDHCVVELPGMSPPQGRVIDHGAFGPRQSSGDARPQRQHFNVVYMRDAP